MPPEKGTTPHPGKVLNEEYLQPLGLTQSALAEHLGVPFRRINEIVRGRRAVTPDTAWRLAMAFDTTPEYWMDLQSSHELTANRPSYVITPLLVKDTETLEVTPTEALETLLGPRKEEAASQPSV